jgi:hypothetical protein
MVKKICESLDLARDIVNDAQTKLDIPESGLERPNADIVKG